MKTPIDKKIVFTIYSHPTRNPSLRWKATLTFEPGSTDGSFASLSVVDCDGSPISEGIFDFAGRHLKVENGRGRLRCADFVKGKHDGAIWFRRPGGVPVPGALTFE